MERSKRRYVFLTIILMAIIVAFSVTAMALSGGISFDPFYNVGEVSEIRETVYKVDNQQDYGHQEASGKVVLDQGEYRYGIGVRGNTDEWHYLCIWLDELSTDTVHWEVVYRIQDSDVESETYSCDLTDGLNLIPVEKNGFDVISIDITGEDGTSFYITNMQLRETEPVFTWGKAGVIFLVVFAGFCAAAVVVYLIIKRLKFQCSPYCWINILQQMYILAAKQLRKPVSIIPQSGRIRNYCRTCLFTLLFLYTVYVEVGGTYFTRFKYNMVIYALLLVLIAALSVGKELRKKNWNNPLVWSWLVLWLLACASDFLIPKEYRYTGYVMILAGGFFIFVWNNMEKPAELIADFARGVHIFFLITMIFCLFCRPETDELRYAGFTTNPSIFALYLGTCLAVVLGEMETRIQKGETLRRLLPFIVEGCAILVLCWKTQSAGPLLCMAGIIFIWLFRMVRHTRYKKIRRSLVVAVVSAVVLFLPVYAGMTWGLKNISPILGTEITYEREVSLPRMKTGSIAYAAEEGNRLEQKLASSSLSQILSGRDYYYRTYLRNMNLLGHEDRPRMWGSRRLPHNAVLGIAYRYGVFAAAPYIIMLLATLTRTFRYGRRKVRCAAIPFYICLSSIVMSMADNVEQPFVWLPWIGLYLMMGCVFDDNSHSC